MEPQRLKAGQGWEWIKQGYALFMKSPILWVVLLSICVVAAVGISSVPVIGEPLVSLLMPVVLAGLMAGCRSLEQGEELELAHLFSGFKQHTSHLVTLGGISLVSQYLIFGAMMLAGGATLVGLLMSGQPDTDPNVMMQALAGSGFCDVAWRRAVQPADDGDAVRPDAGVLQQRHAAAGDETQLARFSPQCRPDAGIRFDTSCSWRYSPASR